MSLKDNYYFLRLAKTGFVVFLIGIMAGCRNRSEEADLINYEILDEIGTELITEVGESEEYFPGQLRDLILMPDGTMLVSDWGKTTIEQFNAEGEYQGTVAEEGGGPGELSSFFLLHKGANDALIVRHRGMNNQMDVFQRETADGLYKHERSAIIKQGGDRHVTFIHPISGEEYLVRASVNIPFFQLQKQMPDYTFTPVALTDEFETILRDSLHILKTPRPVTDLTNNAINVIGMPPYQYSDHLRLMNDGRYLIARPDSSALYIYNYSHQQEEVLHLNVKSRAITSSDLDYHLGEREHSQRVRLEERVGDVKPPFLNIWMSQDHFLLHTDSREEGKEMVILTKTGSPVGKFYLSEFDEIRYFRNNRVYTLYKDSENGHAIRIYEVFL